VIEAYDAQNTTGAAGYWVPLTLETVVIAVDRNQTDVPIATWSDLRESGVSVSILDTDPERRMAAAALCYGLEGRDFSLDSAAELLEPLNARGLLQLDDPAAPIQICFDSTAAARVKNGENIEIVVPTEGTLSYVKGACCRTTHSNCRTVTSRH